jgi:3'-5' exonuclease
LRPLHPIGTPTNELETLVSNTLQPLFQSTALIKVGYQVASDLGRLTASYPHIPCFQHIESVLEAGSLIKEALRISRQKKSRYITMSLASMISHYLDGMSISKNCQLSDWASRPLSSKQKDYAALDAAVVPVLIEKALESIGGYVSRVETAVDDHDSGAIVPILERFQDDKQLSKEILSWRFLPLQKDLDEEKIAEAKAKNMVGPVWIVSEYWITGEDPPLLIV